MATNDDPSPIGRPVPPHPAQPPTEAPIPGSLVTLERLSPDLHTADLYDALSGPSDNESLWTYIPSGPFLSAPAFATHIASCAHGPNAFYAVVDNATRRAVGHVALMRIDLANRVVEVGFVVFGRGLQRTRAATEVFYLLGRHVFETLGYRRWEWKCDALNEPSRRAAGRLGFSYEGLFRQHMIYKGRNRDTAWFSMLDGEWDRCKRGFELWLADGNFDEQGRQKAGLAQLRDSAPLA